MILEILSDDKRIGDALKELESHNEKEFKKSGFSFHWLKDKKKGKYLAYFIYDKHTAMLGMKVIGRKLILRAMKKQFKKIDPDVKINEIKKMPK